MSTMACQRWPRPACDSDGCGLGRDVSQPSGGSLHTHSGRDLPRRLMGPKIAVAEQSREAASLHSPPQWHGREAFGVAFLLFLRQSSPSPPQVTSGGHPGPAPVPTAGFVLRERSCWKRGCSRMSLSHPARQKEAGTRPQIRAGFSALQKIS